ncbi:MAG: hypothetical protein HWD92_07215 [Flavobacteriia bacterium]|nr:hypothetical protein [Flavobacteriia bacterium]
MKKIITSAIALFVGLSMQAQQEETSNTLPAQRTVQTTESANAEHLGRGGNVQLNLPPQSQLRQMSKRELRQIRQRETVPARRTEETIRR